MRQTLIKVLKVSIKNTNLQRKREDKVILAVIFRAIQNNHS